MSNFAIIEKKGKQLVTQIIYTRGIFRKSYPDIDFTEKYELNVMFQLYETNFVEDSKLFQVCFNANAVSETNFLYWLTFLGN